MGFKRNVDMKRMLIFTCFLASMVSAAPMTPREKTVVKQIKPTIVRLMKQNHVPGLAIALVNNKGVLWSDGFGYTDLKHSYKITPSTIFSVQSQSKMVTATGVMLAVQQGKLNLERPISEYLPDLKAYTRNNYHPVAQMNLKQLMSHTAGFTHDAPIGNNNDARASYASHVKSILKGTWLKFNPGTDYSYSNVGVELEGLILQRVSKRTFIDYMREHLFKPLQMNDSTYDVARALKNKKRAIGTVTDLAKTPVNYSMLAPAGLYSTAKDMAHYIQFQLDNGRYGGRQILDKRYIKLMQQIPYPKQGQRFGTAFGIWRGLRHHDIYYAHLGRGFGFSSTSLWYPAYNLGVTVLTNGYGSNTDLMIANDILEKIIATRKKDELKKLEPKMLGNYISNNFSTISFSIINVKNGLAISGGINSGVEGNIIKQGTFPLKYIGHHEFYNNDEHRVYRYNEQSVMGVPTLTRVLDGATYYFNDGPNDKPGPARKAWGKYVGTYSLPSYGKPWKLTITIKHGYLYLDQFRMHEYKPGIFFAANGNPLVLLPGKASWNNISIHKD